MTQEPFILYIDDERPALELISLALKLAGYEITGVTSSEQGLAMMRERKPDLLLLDLMMPGISGWDVYRAIKMDEALADVPVIVVTARVLAQHGIIIEGLPPVDDYITKPIDVKRLIRSIQKFVLA
jgi:two-component system phosphate regulon response regulator PhoB